MFLTLVRLRPDDHRPSSCKYDSLKKKQELLRNAPEVAVLEDFSLMKVWREIFDFEPQISNQADKPDWDIKYPGGRTNHFRTEGVLSKPFYELN